MIIFPAPRPECTTDPECPDHLACVQEKCQDPCYSHSCGRNAECKAKNHRAICVCIYGYVGDPYTLCEERKHSFLWFYLLFLGTFFEHIPKSLFYISFHFTYTAGCKSDNECPLTQACINRECQNPCPFERCGINAECSVRNHNPKCVCLPDHIGNPYDRCRKPECLTDPDCSTTLTCRNEKCVDPCDCAQYADCTARNHRGICKCQPGYTGDPYGIACTPSKSLFNLD